MLAFLARQRWTIGAGRSVVLSKAMSPKVRDLFSLPFGWGIPRHIKLNMYEPGQGIPWHTDQDSYGPVVALLSLMNPIVMTFTLMEEEHTQVLEPRSLLVLEDESRWKWNHGIPARTWDDEIGSRDLRFSVVYRDFVATT